MAKGFDQEEGVDYNETYSPIVCFENHQNDARGCNNGGDAHGADGRHHGLPLGRGGHEEVYMEIPARMFPKSMPDKVLRLLKAFYGLKHSSHM